jgi:hypothetical protein
MRNIPQQHRRVYDSLDTQSTEGTSRRRGKSTGRNRLDPNPAAVLLFGRKPTGRGCNSLNVASVGWHSSWSTKRRPVGDSRPHFIRAALFGGGKLSCGRRAAAGSTTIRCCSAAFQRRRLENCPASVSQRPRQWDREICKFLQVTASRGWISVEAHTTKARPALPGAQLGARRGQRFEKGHGTRADPKGCVPFFC